ncbi:MAG: transcription antitermination factor NusB [Treponema sp.]|nr:transcription antitermination factor NusB [Treponema sp.]
MSRRKGRILAFQGLYSWDVSQSPLEEVLKFSWLQSDKEDEEQIFAAMIISGTVEHIKEIDALITKHISSNWTFERINKVSLAILRTSVYQMKFQAGVEPKIVIDEAVNIAREYGPEDSYKFINAVLDKIGKEE